MIDQASFSLVIMGVLLLAISAFWAWHTHLLINKLMSRNYVEFTEATKPKKTVARPQGFNEDYSTVEEIMN